jgi:hypothetical protein
MKRIALLLTLCLAAFVSSCEGDRGPQGPAGPDSMIYEISNANFAPTGNGMYRIYRTFGQDLGFNLYDSESVLVYRLSGTIDAQTPIWQLIPRTLYVEEGELDYDYDFSKEDLTIYAGGTYDLSQTPEFLSGQTFRIVILPGYFANKGAIDFNDYDAVLKAFDINPSKVTQL